MSAQGQDRAANRPGAWRTPVPGASGDRTGSGWFGRPYKPAVQIAIVLGLLIVATLGRLGVGAIDSRVTPFSFYFPAVLAAVVLGGWRIGAITAALSAALIWLLFIRPLTGPLIPLSTALMSMGVYLAAAAVTVAVAGYIGVLVRRKAASEAALAERNLNYDTLIGSMAEGFALCEGMLDADGNLTDYLILEMNPALQAMLGVGPEAVGGLYSATPGDNSVWLSLCDRVLKSGEPRNFEYHNLATGRWHEIHINAVTRTRMAQLFFDITDMKAAQARQVELFDELNHRVKNNLAIVASILSTQGRGNPALGAELAKAVDRVHSIAAVHESLRARSLSAEIDFGEYLESLGKRLSDSLLDDERIRIRVDARPAPVSADHAVALGMVVNELVTNAVKYAYPAPEQGDVHVRFQGVEGGALLTVSDSGRGLPEDYEGRPGVGLRLLRSMVDQVGGRLEVRTAPGAAFEILLPEVRVDAA